MQSRLRLAGALLGATLLSSSLFATQWTARDAVATALRHHPDAAIARERLTAAEAMITQARAAGLPQLSLSGRYTQTNSPMHAFGAILNQRAFTPGLDFNRPGRIDNLNVAGTVGVTLYSGGRTTASRRAAEAGARAAAEELRAAHLHLANSAIQTLLNLRKAREAVGAVTAGVRAYEAALANTRLRFEAGQVLKADLLSLEVKLAETREALTGARHGAALAERAFLFVLGLEPAAHPSVELAPVDESLESLTAPESHATAQRPELAAIEQQIRAAEQRVAIARSARRPQLNAFASYQYDHGWKLDRHGDSWAAGVAIDLNLFDGGQTTGSVRQASAELAAAKEMLRRTQLALSLEIEQARLAYDSARERLAVSTQTVSQAEESAALSRARFDEGALLAADLIGVETRLLEARLRRTVAEADERLALAELHRAHGLNPFANP